MRNNRKTNELKIIVLSHCILNRATRWWRKGKSLKGHRGMATQILELLSSFHIGVIQLPCPEFTFCGNPRPPRTVDEYMSLPGFLGHCARLADETARYLKSLIENAREPPIRIVAILGIERSPACGVECTPVGRGDEKRYERRKGIFIDLLIKSLRNLGIEIPVIGVDLDRPEDLLTIIDELIRRHKHNQD